MLILACLQHLSAQPYSNLRLSEYQKQDWQVEEGLPQNDVRMIAQRADGTLIVATGSGIASFDGLHFRVLPISDMNKLPDSTDNEPINAILPVGNDEMWIGTDGRGILHQTRSGTVNISERASRFHERIRNFYLDSNGVLWIATQNGIERYVNGSLEAISAGGMISGDLTMPFAEDDRGGMLYITSSGLYYWRNGAVKQYPLHLPQGETPVGVYRDRQRRIWLGTTQHILQLVPHDASAKDLARDDLPQFDLRMRGKLSGPVSTMMGDTAGNLWIGTRRSGLWRLTAEGLTLWSSRDGLADDAIRYVFLDDEQNVWVGMLSGGLSRWRKGALATYGDPEGLHATYSANVFADSHGDLWLGTWDKGLFRRHNGRLMPSSPPGMPISTPIRALAEDRNGQIWVGTWFDGVYRFDGRSFHHYLLGNESPGNAVSVILPAKNGGLWIGTYTGLLYYPAGEPDPSRRTLYLDAQLITCLVEDRDGSVLAGTNAGLYRIRDGKTVPVVGLTRTHILSLISDSAGSLWAGVTTGGLVEVRGDHAVPLPASSGLPAFNINTLTEDSDRHLWMGTSRGIVRVSLAELHAVAEGRKVSLSTVILDRADGMRSSECRGPSKPASTRTADGTLWFATSKGFVHTTDVAERLDGAQTAATIVGWTPSIDPNSPDLVPTSSTSTIELEPGHSDLLVFFNAKLLSNPSHIEFRYRLAGYDTAWTATRARVARYRHLPPGSYHFEVQARRSGEDWQTPIATMDVRQRPYLYQTWYFYVIIVLVAVALTVQFFRRRIQLMKGRIGIVLEERSRIARECHDTLMAGFAAVSWQLEATSKLFRDSNSQNTAPAQSCELARSMVAHCQAEARRIIWDLRDTDEVTNVLSHALSRTLSLNVAPETIETTFNVDGDEVALAPGCVHHLVCIGQEAVSNAIRHAEASQIHILLRYESDSLALSIRDNGRGFQRANVVEGQGGHFGIPVMEERARKLGGTLKLQTAIGGGTEVTVQVPFNALPEPMHREHHVIRWIGI